LQNDDYSFDEVWQDLKAKRAPLCNEQIMQLICTMTGEQECM
jgi:hypothetical protein